MNFDVKIDCRALFNECVDQTLLDYRNRTTEAGQSMTATHTLELSCSMRSCSIYRVSPKLSGLVSVKT